MSKTQSTLFVVGAPFSGATLLSHMLGTHSRAFDAGDVAGAFRESLGSCSTCTPAGTPCPAWDSRAVRAAMKKSPQALYAALAEWAHADVVIDASKTAEWLAARLQEVAAQPTGVRIVFCTSDPVTAAQTEHLRTGESPLDAAARWHDQNAQLLLVAMASGRPVLRVAYDDLRANTELTLRTVCEFAGLAFEPGMGDWHAQRGHGGGNHAESSYGTPRPLVPTEDEGNVRAVQHWLGQAIATPLHVSDVRRLSQTLGSTMLTGLLGYGVTLPERRADASDAERERDREWARNEVAAAQEALLRGDHAGALETLAVLFEWFGPAFDELGLDLRYESIAAVLFDLLSREGRLEDAMAVARVTLDARPDSVVVLGLVASTQADQRAFADARASFASLLALAGPGTLDEAALAAPLASTLAATHPDDASFAALVTGLAPHAALLARVRDLLAERCKGGGSAGAYAAWGMTIAASGDLAGAARTLEDGLTWHSRSTEVQNALFAVQGQLHPGDARYQLKGRFCRKPFENLELLENGAHLCCAVWMPDSIGNPFDAKDADALWNSPRAQDMRRSIHDGSYRWCNKLSCPSIQNGTLPSNEQARAQDPRWKQAIDEQLVVLPFKPDTVNLSYDKSCNLACPSCRVHVIQSNDKQRARLDEMTDRLVIPLVEQASRATITGSGDPFGSRTFRRLLERIGEMDLPKLVYHIATNGLLLTPDMWEKFPKLLERTDTLGVSVDASTPATYSVLRRPGNMDKLIPNLRHMGALHAAGKIRVFGIHMVVQVENYREMPDFVRLAKDVGASLVVFQRLTNWDTFTREEFAKRAVFHEDHPEYEEFLRVMQDPILKDPMVDLGMLRAFVRDPQETRAEAA